MIRQNIIDNLRTDLLTIDGSGDYTNTISKAFKSLRFVNDLVDSDFDSCYIGAGRETIEKTGNTVKRCTWTIHGLIYFQIAVDTQNSGTLETKAETIIEDLFTLNESWANALASTDKDTEKCVESIELVSNQPYINVGSPDRGEIEFELRIIYYRG